MRKYILYYQARDDDQGDPSADDIDQRDVIIITGRIENCENAKKALLVSILEYTHTGIYCVQFVLACTVGKIQGFW